MQKPGAGVHFIVIHAKERTRELAFAIIDIIEKGRFANSVIQKKFSVNKHWSDDERSLVAESVYFIVRNWRRLWYSLDTTERFDTASVMNVCAAAFVLNRVSMNRIVKQMVHVDPERIQKRWNEAEHTRQLKYSLPDWLDKLGAELYAVRWESVIEALHREPEVALRVNTLVTTREKLDLALGRQDFAAHTTELSADALILDERANVFGLEEFKKGMFEVQDAGSQCIAPFCELSAGMRVIDACAGSGGKALHLAALMKNKGRIVALDTEDWKLKDLEKRARRAGVSIIETRRIDSTKVVKRLHESAERVLLDVPCSGLGVLRRNPDTKWHLAIEDFTRFVTIQRDILTRYSKMVAPQGKLIYATCSILPMECEDQVQWFLKENPQWALEQERRLQPDVDDCDGFYMARLIKQTTMPKMMSDDSRDSQ